MSSRLFSVVLYVALHFVFSKILSTIVFLLILNFSVRFELRDLKRLIILTIYTVERGLQNKEMQ